MQVVAHAGARAFLDRAEGWLLGAEDEHNLVLSLAYARSARNEGTEDDLFATAEESGEVVGCALRTPPHKLALTRMPAAAVPHLLDVVLRKYDRIPAVLGPRDVAEPVAAGWAAARGAAWHPGMRQRLYRLDEVAPPRPVGGELRRANRDELGLALEWAAGFADDAGAGFGPSPDSVERWIERGDLHYWVDGVPVSMMVAQGRTPNGIRIGFVYTPRERRGRGYASAGVAELSERMLASGLSFCVLYTDLGNPVSNRIYERIGYRPVCDVVDCEILPVD